MEKELWLELVASVLSDEDCRISFPHLEQTSVKEIVEMKCYQLLKMIRDILRHPHFSDEECFARIDELITLFFEQGISVGERHD